MNHDKYADAMLLLLLMCMMVTLMLTSMVSVGLLLERARKGTYRDAGTAAGPCSTAGMAGSCDRQRAVASSCNTRTRTNPLESQGRQPCVSLSLPNNHGPNLMHLFTLSRRSGRCTQRVRNCLFVFSVLSKNGGKRQWSSQSHADKKVNRVHAGQATRKLACHI